MDNNEAWRNRQTVDAHYKQQLADVEAQLTRTKKALGMAMDGLRNIGNVAISHFGSDWDVVRSLSSETRASIRKELGE